MAWLVPIGWLVLLAIVRHAVARAWQSGRLARSAAAIVLGCYYATLPLAFGFSGLLSGPLSPVVVLLTSGPLLIGGAIGTWLFLGYWEARRPDAKGR
ncbi:MAG: hypothetical protein M1337_08130 [Actinobacteria bacterium]|nr:hypothetical protein [Actinomycetota bacterium]